MTTRAQLLDAARGEDRAFLRAAAEFPGGLAAAQAFMRGNDVIRDGGSIQLVERTSGVADTKLQNELRIRKETLDRLAADARQRSTAAPGRSRPKPLYRSAAPVMKAKSGPAWRLPGSAPTLDPTDRDVQTTARHEAGHAAMAHLLGWTVTEVRLNAGGGGYTSFRPPKNLDRSLRHRQRALICLAGRAHTGWTYHDGDKQDRRKAHNELAQIGGGIHLSDAVKAEAQQMAATTKFRAIARRVEEALLQRGKLNEQELAPLLREASREYARAAR